jgi:hypothetical protein
MTLSDMSIVDYPTTATSTADVFSAHDSTKAMSCLAFTNTHGKSNPGNRVDMDVSTTSRGCVAVHRVARVSSSQA